MTFKSGHLEFEENYNRVIGPDYGLKCLDNPVPIRYVTGLLTGLLCTNLPRVAGFRRARACRLRYKNRPSPGNLKFQARKSAKPTRMGWGGQKLGPLACCKRAYRACNPEVEELPTDGRWRCKKSVRISKLPSLI